MDDDSGSGRLRILTIHNAYQQAGGEDTVFANETELLRGAGHQVETLSVSNDAISSKASQLGAALSASYNRKGRAFAAEAIAAFRPDVVHVHNTFPRLSPAVFDACHAAGVPVVWTLHNYRVTCANAILLRDDTPCEDCVGRAPLPAIRHRCYRGSLIGSAAVAGLIWRHQRRGTWHGKVSRFLALTQFARQKFIAAGLPAERIVVKPNFASDPRGERAAELPDRTGALFVGRLSAEKGVDVLVKAWHEMGLPLTIIGDGPERAALEAIAGPEVRFLGRRDGRFVQEEMSRAAMLVVPSVWYEMYPMTVVEAMACGTPVLASRIGALTEIVEDGVTGHHFNPGDPADLARTVQQAMAQPQRLAGMGRNARAHYESALSPGASLAALETVYRQVMVQ